MNHKVNSVADLYISSTELYGKMVVGNEEMSAAMIEKNLREGIEILKNSWAGVDAVTQINNVVTVYNAIVKVKNALADLAFETTKIAADYRSIQRANGATNLEDLVVVKEEAPDFFMSPYSDTRDTVNVGQEAVNAKSKIEAASNAMSLFMTETKKYFDQIMENWTAGPNRDKAAVAFDEFTQSVPRYKNLLEEVSRSLTTALQNYGM